MTLAALYDIHGNLPALRAVLAEAAQEGVSQFVIGGDVAAGPMPGETIAELMALSGRASFVLGNADREIVEARDRGRTDLEGLEDPALRAAVFAAGQITAAQRDFLAAFEPTVTLDVAGVGEVLFCHGSPRSDTEILTSVTSEDRLRGIVGEVDADLVVCGHTHRQFDRSVDGLRVINAGSVGIPYEGRPGAYWALLGADVQLRLTDYDVVAATGQLRAAGFPDLDEMLQESLLEPADPDEVARFFEGQAS